MTVAIALKDGDDLFLATDCAVGGLPVKELTDHKIQHAATLPLAWAGAGDEAISQQFGRWLNEQVAQSPTAALDWDGLVRATVERLAQLNGVRTRAAGLNHITFDPTGDLCQILMVGYVSGIAEIVHLGVKGDWTLHVVGGRSFAAIGSGSDHAATIYALLKERGLLPENGADAIREVATLATRYAPHCQLPVRIVKVTPTEVMQVQ
ncbi:MAG: hypothetical protein EPO26_07345 [Chloroflexota bacterium]|nr:MAG: hypothetical protein EPO26_07345 [Chloroflexota bacterium]